MSSKILITGFAGILALQIISVLGQDVVRPGVLIDQLCCTYCLESKITDSISGFCCECVRNITVPWPCDPKWEKRIIDDDPRCNTFLKNNKIYPKIHPCNPKPCCQYCLESNVTISDTGVCCNCIKETTQPCENEQPQTKGDDLCNRYLTQLYPRNVKENCTRPIR